MTQNIRCPFCGGKIFANVTSHRDQIEREGFDCDNWKNCGAEWDNDGNFIRKNG